MAQTGCTEPQIKQALSALGALLDTMEPEEAADRGAETLQRLRNKDTRM